MIGGMILIGTAMVKLFTTKVLGYSLLGSLLLAGVLFGIIALKTSQLNSAKEVIQDLNRWRDGVVVTTRLASGNPEVTPETTVNQIQAMGNSLAALHTSLKNSNDAVDKLAEEAEQAKEKARQEAKRRAAAIREAERLAAKLERASLTPVSPEDVEAEIRRTQDELFEAGL